MKLKIDTKYLQVPCVYHKASFYSNKEKNKVNLWVFFNLENSSWNSYFYSTSFGSNFVKLL